MAKIQKIIDMCKNEYPNISCENCSCNTQECLEMILEKFNEESEYCSVEYNFKVTEE